MCGIRIDQNGNMVIGLLVIGYILDTICIDVSFLMGVLLNGIIRLYNTLIGIGSRNMAITRIHINQHIIKANKKNGTNDPAVTVKIGKSNKRYHVVDICGPSKVIYSPNKPLSCGARCWIETTCEVFGE